MEEVVCVSDLHGRREVGATQGAVAGNKQSRDVGRYDSRDGGGSAASGTAAECNARSSCRDSRLPGCVKTRPQTFRWEYLCKEIQILALSWHGCEIFPQHLDIEWEFFPLRKKFLEFLHSLLRGND